LILERYGYLLLLDWLFTVLLPVREFFTHGDATTIGEGMKHLDQCLAPRVFE
jgi:hypothetical protein